MNTETAKSVASTTVQTAVGFVVVAGVMHTYNKVQNARYTRAYNRETYSRMPATSRRVQQTKK